MDNHEVTVGEVIKRLFPTGFSHYGYYYILSEDAELRKSKMRVLSSAIGGGEFYYEGLRKRYRHKYKEILKELSKRKIDYSEKDHQIYVSNNYDNKEYLKLLSEVEWLNDTTKFFQWIRTNGAFKGYWSYRKYIKTQLKRLDCIDVSSIPKEYLVPPISPFDMFALTSTLLLDSGAYHHFENSFENAMFSPRQDTRIPAKSYFVRCRDISIWREIGEQWKNLTGNDWTKIGRPFKKTKKRYTFDFSDKKNLADDEYEQKTINNCVSSGITPFWIELLSNWNSPVYEALSEETRPPIWWYDAYSLMSISDEASKGVGFKRDSQNEIERCSKWCYLAQLIVDSVNIVVPNHDEKTDRNSVLNRFNTEQFKYVESLSIANRSFVNVLPKSRTAPLGCTLRRVSHNLASLPGRGVIKAGWAWAEPPTESVKKNPVFNVLLIPYPYEIKSTNFKPNGVSNDERQPCNLAALSWGAFTLNVVDNAEEDAKFINFVSRLIEESDRKVGTTHAVILPELALSRKSILTLRNRIIKKHKNVELLCSGVRENLSKSMKVNNKPVPVNGAYMASLNVGDSEKPLQHEFFHEKHHRWRITAPQIDDYGLSPTLDPSRTWWEDLRVVDRKLPFLVMRDQWTITSLICEDLARNDPAKSVVESIGPNLVISLLMDGPQVPERWSARYATVLAEDPGSSVLSMSSFGLIQRSNKRHKSTDNDLYRSFALWRDDRGNSIPIKLDERNHACTVSINVFPILDYTSDGRSDSRAVSLRLTGQRQIRDTGEYKKGKYPPWGSSSE